mgnify:CR=1 FL=1
MNSYKQLCVLFDGSEVGQLAITLNYLVDLRIAKTG